MSFWKDAFNPKKWNRSSQEAGLQFLIFGIILIPIIVWVAMN